MAPRSGSRERVDLLTSTRVLQGNGFGNLESLEPGQSVLFNHDLGHALRTRAHLEIWLDEISRQ